MLAMIDDNQAPSSCTSDLPPPPPLHRPVPGTPGVGKSTTCEQLSEATGLQWLNVSEIAQQADCLDEFDPQYGCRILNEDKVRARGHGYMGQWDTGHGTRDDRARNDWTGTARVAGLCSCRNWSCICNQKCRMNGLILLTSVFV